ncbi:ROK family glucokinase [Calditerricola satsumensis]|uniref:Glucokinase n=1 Tax=Calditerricola satsumensis TaxID=373054 RepID=A0A8J3F929_9BACI|nr:ROK family glucokinase [Calditerricola satsumensis]GGJ91002.1 glucokinase [Calditerricola satsumensis]
MAGKRLWIGVDIGGTAIKAGVVDEGGRIVEKREIPTATHEGPDRVLERLVNLIVELKSVADDAGAAVGGVGVGVPGPALDVERGVVIQAVNLGWENVPLRDRLVAGLPGLPVAVDNDANLAALGEAWTGGGRGAQDLLVITVGTGVGGGVVIGGRVHHGADGLAGEIGHVTVRPEGGHRCNCGKTGCLETEASATAIIREATAAAQSGRSARLAEALAQNGALTARDVVEAAQAGDGVAQAILAHAGQTLGLALANAANLLNPERIVVGGGVSHAGELLFAPLREAYRAYALPAVAKRPVVPAELGNDAGLIGAACLAMQQVDVRFA